MSSFTDKNKNAEAYLDGSNDLKPEVKTSFIDFVSGDNSKISSIVFSKFVLASFIINYYNSSSNPNTKNGSSSISTVNP